MRLMKYSPSDWLDIVAMRVEGAAKLLGECSAARCGCRPQAAFLTWRQFMQVMIHRFEPVTEMEEAQK